MNTKDLIQYFKSQNNTIQADLGEITIGKQIGQGGNGLVFKASLFGKEVAIKFLLTEAMGNSKLTKEKRFLAEYFNVNTIEYSKNIVRYIDYGVLKLQEAAVPFIMMKLYAGSINELQENSNAEQFVQLFNFLINTTDFIHHAGIIHRDIKPENILHLEGAFVLTDFGIASYNPEAFKISAETKKGERVGNRLFSAPEQETGGIDADPTMDIYAIGQVLQWYALGATHRGTGRVKITTRFPELTKHDKIIDKCLRNDPKQRYQSVQEILKDFISDKQINVYHDFGIFHELLLQNFPRNDHGVVYSDDKTKIDRLLSILKNNEIKFDEKLWATSYNGDFDFTLKQTGDGRWKFDTWEFDISEIWVHYDHNIYNDFILVHYNAGEPFSFEGRSRYYTTIVDGEHHISASEADSGYAEINGEIITLSEHQVEKIEREDEEGYFLISTRDHCAHVNAGENTVANFMTEHSDTKQKPTISEVKEFARQLRKRLSREVKLYN